MRNQILKLVVAILTVSGCQSTPVDRPVDDPEFDTRDPQVLLEDALVARNVQQAAAMRLAASRIYMRRGDANAALIALESLDSAAGLDDELFNAVQRQRSLALQSLGRFLDARGELSAVTQLSAADFISTAQVCAELQDHRCAADAYIQAAEKSDFDYTVLPEGLNDLIWQHLSLARSAPPMFTHRIHHAWWLLQQHMRSADSVTAQIDAWRRWQADNPSHPARIYPPRALARLADYDIPDIGVLLPLSGPLSGAGQALRDGLISAYLADPSQEKPTIRFYDCSAANFGQLLEIALTDGVDVVVGPLVKDDVDRFAEIAETAQVPTLVLNYLTDTTSVHQFVYQLGIAIEDEAATLASAVLGDGHEQVLVIHSYAGWSQRAARQFADTWPFTQTQAEFDDIKGLTEAVGESMQVAASLARNDQLSRILGQSLEFLPRARKDYEAVIALTTQVESRALIPALRFHFADQLPVYATSQSARGENLDDLNGFTLTELPIFASPNAKQSQMLKAYNLTASPLAELYALGFDAYEVATWLPMLKDHKVLNLDAATGFLSLEPDGRFKRDVSVNHIGKDGVLMPLD